MTTSSDDCASESDSNISSMMSQFVSSLFVAILLNVLQDNSGTQQNPAPSESLIVIQASALPDLSHVIALTGKGLHC
jgi:hypothetical protein